MTLQEDGMTPQNTIETPRVARREFLKMAAAVGGSAIALSQLRFTANAMETVKNTAKKSLTSSKTKTPIPAAAGLNVNGKPVEGYNAAAKIEARTFPNLASVEGISQNQLNQHLELYKGYVKKINMIEEEISNASTDALTAANPTYSPFRELHLEQSYALNGVVLHEYYFENLGANGTSATPDGMLKKVIAQEFGSWENYLAQLTAVGKASRGWAMTAYNMRDHRIHNYGMDLHNQAVPMGVIPILVLDVYEHAYMIDFGTKRPAYLEAFFKNVDWKIVEDRLKMMMLHA